MQVLALGHLGRVGTSAAREQIRMTLKSLGASGDHRVLRTALVMLGSTGEAADLDLILPFARGGVAADVFRNALIALGLIACEQGVGTLQAALVSAGDELRPVIVWALGACGEGAKPALPLLEGLVQGRLAAGGHLALALARVGGVDQAGLIRKILGHHGGEAAWNMERAGAAFALGWCGDLESLDELTRLVEQGLSGQAAPGGDPVFLGAVQGLGQLGAFYGSVEQKGTIITLLGRVIEDESQPILHRVQAMKSAYMVDIKGESPLLTEIRMGKARYPDELREAAEVILDCWRDPEVKLTREDRVLVPAFLPILPLHLQLRVGDAYNSLVQGTWSETGSRENLCDERGHGTAVFMYRAPPMSLVAFFGRNRCRSPRESLAIAGSVAVGILSLGVNLPSPFDDLAFDYVPSYQVRPEAMGFMVVHLAPRSNP